MPKLSETFTIGGLEIAALSDGAPDRALGGFFRDVDPAAWTSAIGITDPEDPVPFNFGSFLIRGDGHITLIDTGYGVPALAMGISGGGELPERITELGLRLEEIDRVIHTHLHGDHVGWNIHDNEDDRLMFPNATFYVHENELNYWTGSASDDNPMAENVRRRINPVIAAGRVEATAGEFAVSEALTMVPAPGHTPRPLHGPRRLAGHQLAAARRRRAPPGPPRAPRLDPAGRPRSRRVHAIARQGRAAGGREGRDRDQRPLPDPLARPHPRGRGRLQVGADRGTRLAGYSARGSRHIGHIAGPPSGSSTRALTTKPCRS